MSVYMHEVDDYSSNWVVPQKSSFCPCRGDEGFFYYIFCREYV